MGHGTFDYFLELPGELREQILAHLVVKPTGVHLGEHDCFPAARVPSSEVQSPKGDSGAPCDYEEDGAGDVEAGHGDDDSWVGWPLNYFLVSQAFRREASSLFFGLNTFHLYAGVRRSTLFDPLSGRGILAPTQQGRAQKVSSGLQYLASRRRVKRVVLHLQRLGGSLGSIIAPCLQDMILAGGLRHLDVRLYHLLQQGADKREALWRSGPATNLIGLLRDPDLEVARLRAYCPSQSPRHLRATGGWCPLLAGLGTDLDPRQWVCLDIEELSRRYGGEEAGICKVTGERPLLRWAGT